MEHFEIVLALCRAALQSPNPAIANHIRRLSKALEKDGSTEQSKLLFGLERKLVGVSEIQPSRVVLSFAENMRETLTPSVKPPVDRETSAALAEIVHSRELKPAMPVFSAELSASIRSLLEEWQSIDKLRAAKIRPVMSLMLFGDPGTGKTMLAHSIAQSLQLPLVVAKLDGLVSSFLGTTARNIANLFAFANRYNCILLLDEFDAVAKLRDDPNELGELKRVVNTLLQCLDARADIGFSIAITNHQTLLDPAIWRRFDVRIEVPKPGFQTRLEILKNNFSPPFSLPFVQMHFLSWLMEGHSGADIERLADFIKRRLIINGLVESEFIEFVRAYLQLSAQSQEGPNRRVALYGVEDIAVALASFEEAPMNQEDLAELFGKTQSTISRWLNKESRPRGKKVN
jgi:SpoVK/Ycf46/Vps4 family AAA+-type ATPase